MLYEDDSEGSTNNLFGLIRKKKLKAKRVKCKSFGTYSIITYVSHESTYFQVYNIDFGSLIA